MKTYYTHNEISTMIDLLVHSNKGVVDQLLINSNVNLISHYYWAWDDESQRGFNIHFCGDEYFTICQNDHEIVYSL